MKQVALCIALLLLGAPRAGADDRVIAAWEFNRPGSAEGWFAAHSLAPLQVAGGVLKTHATGGDPYMVSSQGNALDIVANDFQYVEIRLKSSKEGGAEFFWASTTEGKDAGFVAGKECGFPVRGDRLFHTYRVYPMWKGHITRLRFDPLDDSAIEVDYIRIKQAPPSHHEPTSPRWDFRAEAAGGFVPSSGCRLDSAGDGVRVTLDAESCVISGPPLDLAASSYAYVTVHLTATARAQLVLSWSDATEGTFPGTNTIPFEVGAGEDWVTLPLSDAAAWSGAVRRLSLGIAGKEGSAVTLHSIAFGRQPEGPARLTVVSLSGERSICAVGERIEITLRVRNDGGAAVRSVRPSLSYDRARMALASADEVLPELPPGGSAALHWTLTAREPGLAPVGVRLAGVGLFRATAATTRMIVVKAMPAVSTGAGSKTLAYARRSAAAAIGSDRVRLTLGRGQGGYQVARVDLLDGVIPRTMGYLPYLARVAVGSERAAAPVPMSAVSAASDRGSATLKLRGSRAGVTVDVTYSASAGKPWIDATYRVSAAAGVLLRAFDGPWLWAGEGSFADDQDHALFPGVEWLVRGERSSTSLDIAPPMHTRFAPHPNWVTVPAMAVEKDNAIVGLMWNPLQKWNGTRTRPSAVFASPNFVEGRRNHLMGLFLPSIPDFVRKNALLAAQPYRLTPGRTLTLKAAIFAEADSDVTAAPLMWYRRYCGDAAAPSLPQRARGYQATLDMAMKSYETVLWQEAAGAWMPVVGWAPGRDLGVAAMYDTMTHLRPADPGAAAWREKVRGVAAGSNDLTFALRGSGDPQTAIGAVLAAGRGAADAQPEGARYAFHPDAPRKSLGPDGGTAVGIAAGPTENLLNLALRTGDRRTIDAGLRGLAFMDHFDVPRASQVWECPLHSPDILASGQACRAYLAGYRLTGNTEYLRKAIFWARTGLPFVYAWRAPDMPRMMAYATIPIFGATFYTGSWFGVPVQWNGLDYANACLELAHFDRSLPWRTIGEGITISGINQQSTRARDYGTYTDNWNVVTNAECVGCMLSPGAIMGNVFRLMGVGWNSGVDGVVTPDGWIAVNGPGLVSDVSLHGGVLSARASHFAGETGTIAILPVDKPSEVRVDGQTLVEQATGKLLAGQWRYTRSLGLVTVCVRFGAAPASIAVQGVRRVEPAADQTEWRFGEAGDSLGWVPANDLSEPVVANGALRMVITGGDPYFVSPPFAVDAAKVSGFAIRARVASPGGQFFWANSSGGFAPARCVSFDLPADGLFHDVVVDLTTHPDWRGTIRQLRVDFNGGKGDSAELAWARVVAR